MGHDLSGAHRPAAVESLAAGERQTAADAGPPSKARDRERLSALDGPHPSAHWPALDGLRAIAVLAVMGVHLGVLPGGYVGVDVFFVLSGFLITSLLIGEWDRRGGRISFGNFYLRRVLRLFPALGCVIVVSAVLAVLLEAHGGEISRASGAATLAAIPWVVLFVVNWVQALHFSSFLGLLAPTWSLAVEEQFYLVWPALFLLLMRRRFRRHRLALWLAAAAVAVMAYRIVMAHTGYGGDRIYDGTDTHCDGLLLGCAAAFWLASQRFPRHSHTAATLLKRAAGLGTAILAILFVAGNQGAAPLDISVAVLASAAVVTAAAAGHTPAAVERVLRSRWAVWTGRRSYGLYLWQYVILVPAEALTMPYTRMNSPTAEHRLLFGILALAAIITWLTAATLTYRLVELPALRLKRRFQTQARSRQGGTHP